jgi:hypothetical protein
MLRAQVFKHHKRPNFRPEGGGKRGGGSLVWPNISKYTGYLMIIYMALYMAKLTSMAK